MSDYKRNTVNVLMVGDTHGIHNDARYAVESAEAREVDLIIQLGDFAFDFKDAFLDIWAGAPCPVYFIRGNHDSTDAIKAHGPLSGDGLVDIYDNVSYIQDGAILDIGKSRVAGLGGAVSIDKDKRREWVSWWADEPTSTESVVRLLDGHYQHADVLLAHDSPEGVKAVREHLKGWPVFPATEVNRQLVRMAFDHLRPSRVFHGHYHYAYSEHFKGAMVHGLHYRGASAVMEVTL